MSISNNFDYEFEINQESHAYRGTLSHNGKLAGCVSIRFLEEASRYPDRKHLWLCLDDLYVFPEFRGKGLGRILVE